MSLGPAPSEDDVAMGADEAGPIGGARLLPSSASMCLPVQKEAKVKKKRLQQQHLKRTAFRKSRRLEEIAMRKEQFDEAVKEALEALAAVDCSVKEAVEASLAARLYTPNSRAQPRGSAYSSSSAQTVASASQCPNGVPRLAQEYKLQTSVPIRTLDEVIQQLKLDDTQRQELRIHFEQLKGEKSTTEFTMRLRPADPGHGDKEFWHGTSITALGAAVANDLCVSWVKTNGANAELLCTSDLKLTAEAYPMALWRGNTQLGELISKDYDVPLHLACEIRGEGAKTIKIHKRNRQFGFYVGRFSCVAIVVRKMSVAAKTVASAAGSGDSRTKQERVKSESEDVSALEEVEDQGEEVAPTTPTPPEPDDQAPVRADEMNSSDSEFHRRLPWERVRRRKIWRTDQIRKK